MAVNVLIVVSLLTIGFVGTRVAAYLRIPHSVFLVFLGVTLGIFLHGHGSGDYIASVIRYFPDVVLFLLLPPLIFETSYRLEIADLVSDIAPLTTLAVGALVISTALIGFSLHYVLHLQILPCLTFGALISATDPVAVVSLFREIGAPKRLQTLIEGESLLNDGTAMVLYRLLLGATLAAGVMAPSLKWTALDFVYNVGAGVMVGIVIALLISALLRLVSHAGAPQLGLTVASAYLSFIIAERFLHVSGVIATMTVGLYLGNRARFELNREAAEGMSAVWEFLSLAANILVFFAVGLSVDLSTLISTSKYIPVTLLVVYAARAISVYGTIPIVNRLASSSPIPLSYQTVLFWGGLRGGLALGLVLTLPSQFPHRDVFIALAISVVFATLFVNAVTAGSVLRLLRLNRLNERERIFQSNTFKVIESSVFEPMLAGPQSAISATIVRNSRDLFTGLAFPRSDSRASPLEERVAGDFSLTTCLLRERTIYNEMLRMGALERSAYLELDRVIGLRLALLRDFGAKELFAFSFPFRSGKTLPRWKLQPTGRRSLHLLMNRLSVRFEILQGLKIALQISQKETPDAQAIQLLETWIRFANERIEELYKTYPSYSSVIQALHVARAIRVRGKALLEEYYRAGIINQAVNSDSQTKLRRIYNSATRQALHLLRPNHAYLFSRLSFFQRFPKIGIRRIAESSRQLVFEPQSILVRKGEKAGSFFIVASGMLEVETGGRLFPGDHFGWEEMLFGRPHIATITAAVPSEVLELEGATFNRILLDYPELREDLLRETAEHK